MQAVDEVINGNIPLETPEEVARFVGRCLAVDLGEEMGGEAGEMLEAGLTA